MLPDRFKQLDHQRKLTADEMAHQPPSERAFGSFIEPGVAPPGRIVNGQWQGLIEWRTRHGPAIVGWSLGVPAYAWNAQAAGGQRVEVQGAQPAGLTFRLKTADGFIRGAITILEDDVLFAPLSESADADVDDDQRPLQQIVLEDEAFVHDLSGQAFAAALYHVLENQKFVAPPDLHFEFGQRSAARFVAALRGNGEIYLDYAWGRGPAFSAEDVERVRAHLFRLGIRVAP